MKYITEDYEAGNQIDEFETREEALKAIVGYEAADKADGSYTGGFYGIRHGDECERVYDAEVSLASLVVHRRMGQTRSDAKAAAARANGKKGGRPRKNRKYELTDEVIVLDGHTMHRIKATRQVGLCVKPGDLGGYIESEANLSHEGAAWVGGEARVYGEAKVLDQAVVCNNAIVRDKATVRGFAQVCENSIVCGEAWVGDNALVRGRAVVCGNASVSAHDNMFGNQIRHGGISREEYEAIKAEQSGRPERYYTNAKQD